MSQENVARIRAIIEAYNDAGVEAIVSMVAPDCLHHPFPEWPGPSEYYGPDGFRRLSGEWTDNFDEYRWEIGDLIDAEGRVVSLVHHRARIRDGGAPLRQPIGAVWSAFDEQGRPSEVHYFLSWQEALEAVGLSAQDSSS